MAEASTVAFGRYLRELRERRGMSLSRVCELSKGAKESLDRGTLSRFEHGQQTPSIYRLLPLCRIYEITADALLERMELDRELDRIGEPDTAECTYEELQARGRDAMVRGQRKWDTYAYLRDSLPLAPDDKRLTARINLVTAIRSLEKNALALHELRAIASDPALDPGLRAVVQERMSHCHRCLGDLKQAEACADAAAVLARESGDSRALAYAYTARAGAAIDQEQWAYASDFLTKAIAACGAQPEGPSRLSAGPAFEAQTLLMLAECSFKRRQIARAQKVVHAAVKLSREHDIPVGLAYADLILGWIDKAEGRVDGALARWRRAASLARTLEHRGIVFNAEVAIFRTALERGESTLVRASRRRLERLVPWIPRHIPAFREYQSLTDEGGPRHEDAHGDSVVVARRGVRDRTVRSRQPAAD